MRDLRARLERAVPIGVAIAGIGSIAKPWQKPGRRIRIWPAPHGLGPANER
jgi:hypothetical protein